MSNFIRNLPVYRPNGTPAYAWVKFIAQPLTGDTVTINGNVYTFGTDFFGQSAAQALRSLVAAVRADQSDASEVAATNTNFFRPYWAEFNGHYAVLFATVPGVGGNALTLATSASTRITISGSTFTGGTSQATSGGLTPANAVTQTITTGGTAQTVFAASARSYLLIQNVSDTAMWVNFIGTATAGAGSILLAPAGAGVLEYYQGFIPQGAISVIGATTGKAFTAIQA